MKSMLPYILLITGTLVAAVAVIAGLWYFKPQVLGAAPKPAQAVAQKDSSGARSPGSSPAAAGRDSSGGKVSGASPSGVQKSESASRGISAPALPKGDEASRLADSIRTLVSRIDEQQKTIAQLTEKVPQAGRSDSTAKGSPSDTARAKESKMFAKMLESMPAEQAVRILKGLDDREVKAVLLVVKKRQAAKILGSLDPDRAARMMRTVQ